jgi:hypothetical protein
VCVIPGRGIAATGTCATEGEVLGMRERRCGRA